MQVLELVVNLVWEVSRRSHQDERWKHTPAMLTKNLLLLHDIGKYDNGGRFDLRLPYADQGYVDEDADFMGKLFGKKKPKQEPPKEEKPKKKGGWPW